MHERGIQRDASQWWSVIWKCCLGFRNNCTRQHAFLGAEARFSFYVHAN